MTPYSHPLNLIFRLQFINYLTRLLGSWVKVLINQKRAFPKSTRKPNVKIHAGKENENILYYESVFLCIIIIQKPAGIKTANVKQKQILNQYSWIQLP